MAREAGGAELLLCICFVFFFVIPLRTSPIFRKWRNHEQAFTRGSSDGTIYDELSELKQRIRQLEGERGIGSVQHRLKSFNDAFNATIRSCKVLENHIQIDLDHALGKGVGGEVFPAFMNLPSKIVVKRLWGGDRKPHLSDTGMKLVSGKPHPNVAKVYGICEDETDTKYMIEDRVDGLPLRSFVKSNAPLTSYQVLHIGKQIAEVFDYFHNETMNGVGSLLLFDAHFDQFMVSSSLHVTMIDSDAIQARPQYCRCPSKESIKRNAECSLRIGCSVLLPPESACGQQCDLESEIHILGQFLWFLVEGPRLPPLNSQQEGFPLSTHGLKLHPGLLEVMKACLRKNPFLRPSARDVAQSLTTIQQLLERES